MYGELGTGMVKRLLVISRGGDQHTDQGLRTAKRAIACNCVNNRSWSQPMFLSDIESVISHQATAEKEYVVEHRSGRTSQSIMCNPQTGGSHQ